jgi:hypothetical protein
MLTNQGTCSEFGTPVFFIPKPRDTLSPNLIWHACTGTVSGARRLPRDVRGGGRGWRWRGSGLGLGLAVGQLPANLPGSRINGRSAGAATATRRWWRVGRW